MAMSSARPSGRASAQKLRDRCSVHQLRDDVSAGFRLTDLVDRQDVRMVQSGRGLRFGDEAAQAIAVLRGIFGQDLDRDFAV